MLKHWIEYAFMRATFFVFGRLPVDTASAIGGAIARAIGSHTRLHKHAQKTLALCLPNRADEHAQILRAMWDNLGRSYAEQAHVGKLCAADRTSITMTGAAPMTLPNGGFFVGGHLANWEILPAIARTQLGVPVHAAYRAPNNPLVDAWLKKRRECAGELESIPKTRRGAAVMLRAIKSGAWVGLLMDQKDNTGTVLEFFGLPAPSNTTYADIAVSEHKPVLIALLRRTNGAHFAIDVDVMDTNGRTPAQIAQDFTTRLEIFIRNNPQQWLWVHRRFDKELYADSN